jgi:hypothetical protein
MAESYGGLEWFWLNFESLLREGAESTYETARRFMASFKGQDNWTNITGVLESPHGNLALHR